MREGSKSESMIVVIGEEAGRVELEVPERLARQ